MMKISQGKTPGLIFFAIEIKKDRKNKWPLGEALVFRKFSILKQEPKKGAKKGAEKEPNREEEGRLGSKEKKEVKK